MRELVWAPSFVRAFKRATKKNPSLRREVKITLQRLAKDPFDSRLASHKLKGKLAGTWACSVGYDLRILFDFVESEAGDEKAVFLLEIGTHDEVY